MAHERRRAALAALCVVAVALAAALFPASGFGGQPAGVGVGGGPDAPAPGDSGPDGSPDPASTATPDDSPDSTTQSPDDGSTGDQSSDPTTTTTRNKTTAASDTDPGGTDLFSAVLVAALGSIALFGFVGLWTGALAVTGGATAGPLPFTLTLWGTPVGELVGRVPTRTMALVVGLSSSIPRLLDDAAGLTGAVGSGFASVLGAAGRGTAEALRIGAQGLGATAAALPRALAGLSAGAGLFASLGNVSVPSFGRNRGGSDRGASTGTRPEDGPEETAPPSVEEAWQAMRDRVAVRNRRARTPGELARAAVRRGYPDDAVGRLTDAFREVRYGGLPREERTEAARSALDRLRDHWRDDE